MAAAKRYYGKSLLWVEPFNEPDYGPWNQGTMANLYDIMGLLMSHSDFTSTGLAGGSTLSCSNANAWYNFVKSRATIGTTHCLGGTFDDYVSWMLNVKASGAFVLNPEAHNLMEVIAGAEYGLQGAIWWGSCSQTRGQFVKSCQGKRLAYSEDRAKWTAAAVYRAPDNVIRCFVGGSERMGVATTYKFVCADRDVWFNGQGPTREFTMTALPDSDGFVEVRWEDVPPVIDGKYVIAARHSGKVMEVAGAQTGNGANVQQWDYLGGNNQKWDISSTAAPYVKMSPAHTGKALEIVGFSQNDGVNIQQWDSTGNENQQWFYEYAGGGYYYIRNRYSGKYAEVAGAGLGNGTNIYQQSGPGSTNQQWKFLPAGYWTKVDDNGTGVTYSAGWGIYSGNPGYQATEHFSWANDSEVTYTFTGSQARYHGYKRNDLGIAEIRVDGVLKATIDCYSATGQFDQTLYQTESLAVGTHTLKVRATGTKNTASSGTAIIADAFSRFTDTAVDFVPPAAPANLVAVAGPTSVALTWMANAEPDLKGYSVHRATAPGGPYQTLAIGVAGNAFTDTKVVKATRYYYIVRASDNSGNVSGNSPEAVATAGGPAGLVARYLMDGTVTDNSGNANHATASGSPAYGAGKTGQALVFDGVDDFVTLPAGLMNLNDITLTAWVKWNGGANWQRVFDFGNDTAFNMYLTPRSASGTLRFGIRDGGDEQTLNAPALTMGQWVHVAVVLNGDEGRLYVNGALADTRVITYNPAFFNPVNLWLGKSQWPDPLFSGSVDDFRLYSSALTTAEISAIVVPVPPVFSVNPIDRPAAEQVAAYSGQTLADSATDANGDAISYSKISGPAWLGVASNGALSGTPAAANVGLNTFVVGASDGGAPTQATLRITVNRHTYALPATDGGGTSSFTAPLTGATAGWPGPAFAGNDYTVTGVALRGPTSGNFTFPGDSLTLFPNGRLLLKTAPAATQTLNVGNLILNGGYLDLATASNDGAIATLAGNITLAAGSGMGALAGETLTVSAAISGDGPLVVSGPSVNAGADTGTVILSGANTYTGSTSVNGGTLVLKSPFLADSSTISITAPGMLKLDFTGTDTVGTLVIGGVTQPDGIYGSANSGGRISGTGSLKVGSAGYAIWAASNIGGQPANADFDGDGVPNGIEFFMGESGNGFTANPAMVNGTVTWPKSAAYTGSYAVQVSTDLVGWSNATTGVTETVNSVVFTMPQNAAPCFVRLKVNPQ
jgi:autotransporter-associated beta strand protein